MKKTLSAILALIMVFSTVIVGISGVVSLRVSADTADGTTDGENEIGTTAISILNQDGTQPLEDDDVRWGDVYGMDDRPFLLTEKNELYIYQASEDYTNGKTWLYDGIDMTIQSQDKSGVNFVETPCNYNNSPTESELKDSSGNSVARNHYRFTTGIGFDPSGSGRKSYAAYVGVVNTSEVYSVHCFVVDPTTSKSWDIELGEAEWVSSNNVEVMSNFMTITAGDYNDDGKDTIVVYCPGDGSDLKLYEVTFDATAKTLSKTELLDLTTVITTNVSDLYTKTDYKYKPIVSLTTGDLDDDNIDELAYSLGFDNTSDNAKDGWDYTAATTMDCFATEVGIGECTGTTWSLTDPIHVYDKGSRISYDGTNEEYKYAIIQGGTITAGDVDGNGSDEVVIVGYTSINPTAVFTNGKMTKVDGVGNLNKSNFATSVISFGHTTQSAAGTTVTKQVVTRTDISTISYNSFTSASAEKWEDSAYVYPHIGATCVATNGTNQAEDVFVAGTFYTYTEGAASAGFSVKVAGQTFNTVLGDSTDTDCYWFGNCVAGTFDDNDAGREQVYFTVWFDNGNTKEYNAYIGIAGGAEYSDTKDTSGNITSYGTVSTYACSDTRGDYSNYIQDSKNVGSKACKEDNGANTCLAPVAVDTDNDGVMARHNSTRYVYSDPEVVAVLQASPTFSKIDELGGYDDSDDGTEYSLTTSYEKSTTRGDTVSFGCGFTGEGTFGPVKIAVDLGYSMDWDHEIETAYGTEYTTTWTGGSEDIVCMTRTPVIIYVYDIQKEDGTWSKAAHEVTAPLEPRQYALSISEYNSFVDQYNTMIGTTAFNKITTADLPTSSITTVSGVETVTGTNDNPYTYYSDATKAATSGTTASAISTTSYQLGYAGGSQGATLSTSASTSESTTFTHGFSFSLSVMGGGGVSGKVELWGGGYVSLDYGDIYGKSTTSGNSKEISGSVANISKSKLAYSMTASEVEQYAFAWKFGKWERPLIVNTETDSSGKTTTTTENVPFYGYFVYDITSPVDPPTDLTAAYTSTDETTNVQLSWTAPESVTNGPKVVGYFIFDNGEAVNTNMLANTSTGTITYLHTGIGYGTKHSYTVRVVSEIDSKRYTSVDSNEADIGWVTTGNIISSIYKDDTYTSTDGLTDRYVIKMSNDDVYYFYVTNGKDGTNGTNGIDGKTAYEIAVLNGYTGTQQEWLNLIGASCADSHTYKTYSIPATCSSQGITVRVCELCGYAEAETTDALAHSYKAYKTVAPTCTQKGYTIYKCENCNDFYIDDETDCTAHTFAEKTVSNSCCTEGYTVRYCTVCGYVESYDVSAAANHDYQVESVIAPTCTTKGYTVYKCSKCGDEITADETSAAGHDYTDETVEATCSNPGFTMHTCKVCNSMYISGYTPALGHYYTVKVTAPTCSQKGYTTYTCDRCGESHIADITECTDHTFNDKIIKNTCLTDGYTIHYCENCGYQQFIDETAASGHNYEASQVIAPTCTTKGYTIYICKDCGASLKSDETDFSDHVSSGWVCENASTGHYVKTCEKCGAILEEKTMEVNIGGSDGSPVIMGESISLDYGKQMTVSAGASDSSNVTYTSSDPSVASVDENGVVTAKDSGTVTIIVTDNDTGIQTSFKVNVKMTWWQRVHKVLAGFVLIRVLFEIFKVNY